jgi:tripeptide aminopeptidase
VSKVNIADLGAAACYTLDGSGADEIDVETFSADLATITIKGVNIHPSIGKNRMVNALKAAARLLALLPEQSLSPETTEGREGFVHPYVIKGGVEEVSISILLRDFVTEELRRQEALLRGLAVKVEAEVPKAKIKVDVAPQYRNMAEGLKREPRAVALAQEAHQRLGREPRLTVIRGGTDGSMFTEKGLPTPNLSTGEHNPHSPLEWTCLEEMQAAAEVLVELAQAWGRERMEKPGN